MAATWADGTLAPAVGLVSAIVVLAERPSSWQYVGGAVILVAVVLLVHEPR